MNISERGLELIKQFEGFRTDAYLCPGDKWTIGYGFTKGVKQGDKITQEQAEKRLLEEVKPFEQGVTLACSNQPSQNEFDAMVCLAYNIGLGNFRQSSVLRDHNKENYSGAEESFHKWNMAAGRVLPGLVKRRAAEARLYGED